MNETMCDVLIKNGIVITMDPGRRVLMDGAVASMVARCPVPELIDAGVTVVMGSDAGAPDRRFDRFRLILCK